MNTPTETETPASLRALADENDAVANGLPFDRAESWRREAKALRVRADAMVCRQNDSNGDGNCGRQTCRVCHPENFAPAPSRETPPTERGPTCQNCGHRYEACKCPKFNEVPTEPDGHTADVIISKSSDSPGWVVARMDQTVLYKEAINARLLAAAYTSYDRHFAGRAVQAAEDDALGHALTCLAAHHLWASVDGHDYLASDLGKDTEAVLARVQRREA